MINENRLMDIAFIGGGDQILIFTLTDKFGEPLTLSDLTIKWTLCGIGQKDVPIVVKDNRSIGGVSIVGNNECRVDISNKDTALLYSSKYEHEIILIKQDGKVLRPSYGYIDIKRGSNY